MNGKSLTKIDIQNFYEILKNINHPELFIEILFSNMTFIIDSSASMTKIMSSLMTKVTFNSMEEMNKLNLEHMNFYNNLNSYLEEISKTEENQQDKQLRLFYDNICNVEDNYKNNIILQIVEESYKYSNYILGLYKDNIELTEYVSNIVKLCKVIKNNDYVEKEEIKELFIMIVKLTILLNEVRKKSFQSIHKQYNESSKNTYSSKFSRNDLCYCGSGKKYKKCCLLKN